MLAEAAVLAVRAALAGLAAVDAEAAAAEEVMGLITPVVAVAVVQVHHRLAVPADRVLFL